MENGMAGQAVSCGNMGRRRQSRPTTGGGRRTGWEDRVDVPVLGGIDYRRQHGGAERRPRGVRAQLANSVALQERFVK